MTSADAEQLASEKTLKEAMELLGGLEFDAVGGGTARTEQLFVSVIPDWEDDARQTFRAMLTCQALWHRKTDWQQMRVSARPQSTSGFFVQHVLPLDANGTATFRGLDAGTYVLKAYCHLVEFTTPQPAASDQDRSNVTELSRGVAMDNDPNSGLPPDSVAHGAAANEEIEVLVASRKGFVTLEFATNRDDLAGKSLEFCVVNPANNEIYLDEQVAVFGTAPTGGRFRTNPIELSLSPGDDVEVSYRII